MGVLGHCRTIAAEAAKKAEDPSLTLEAKIEWTRIARDWIELAEQRERYEGLEGLVSRKPGETIH